MIKVEISRTGKLNRICGGQGSISSIKVRGHAEYAAHGSDIVCAAASAIIYTAAGALEGLCGVRDVVASEETGYFQLIVPEIKDEEKSYRADIILETVYIGFKQIEMSYAKNLKVIEIGN
jgi:uncharacterized protein YsxB (DUF464 family)